jgi:hypothetical protein
MSGAGPTLHDTVGPGFFVDLVDRFYEGVEGDPVLIPLYPDGADTAGARERLAMFLAQYWGGPHDYMERRGHPMLRARHNQWVIGTRVDGRRTAARPGHERRGPGAGRHVHGQRGGAPAQHGLMSARSGRVREARSPRPRPR